jgi:oligosaccharide repeat unit polymerase
MQMPLSETNPHSKPEMNRRIVWVHALVLVVLVLVALTGAGFAQNAEFWIRPLGVMLLLVYLWALWSWQRVTHTLFNPYILFFTAALLFNGGQALLEIFNLNPDGIFGGAFSAQLVAQTLLLVLLGLAFFHFGGLVAVVFGERAVARRTLPNPTHSPLRAVRIVGWCLLALSIVPTLLRLRDAVTLVLTSGYASLFQQTAGTSFDAAPQLLAAFLVPAALFLLAGSGSSRASVIVSLVLMLGYSATEFFLGSRSAAAMPLIAFAWVYHRTVRPLPALVLAAVGGVALFVIFPLVQAVRVLPGGERLDVSTLVNAFVAIQNPIVSILNEMGGSMVTVTFTLELVPAVRSFDYGIGYFYALLTLVPNLFWQVHPTVAHGLATQWLVQTVAPLTAAAGGGYGYSFIAEAYLNFGWVGAPLCLAVLGWLWGKLVWWGETSGDSAKIAMVASFFAFALFFARSESAAIVRPLVWYALLPYFVVLVIARATGKETAGSTVVEQV